MENGTFNVFSLFLYSADSLQAPGEVEAELTYLNSTGVIDAILSDDVDNILFGATTVICRCIQVDTPVQIVSHSLLNPVQALCPSVHPSIQLT